MSFFRSCIPFYVKPNKRQDGLCSIHHTGLQLKREFIRKRALWHGRCKCRCSFCKPSGCNHGKNPNGRVCAEFTCHRCKQTRCPVEWQQTATTWFRPVQEKRQGGGVTWVNEACHGSRKHLMKKMKDEMKVLVSHGQHVVHNKSQMRNLLENLQEDGMAQGTPLQLMLSNCRGCDQGRFYSKHSAYAGQRDISIILWPTTDSNAHICRVVLRGAG